jgi:hypothetical protein
MEFFGHHKKDGEPHEVWHTRILLSMYEILIRIEERQMADTTKLTASVARLTKHLDDFLASQVNDQPAVDAAQQDIDTADAKLTAATPAPTA